MIDALAGMQIHGQNSIAETIIVLVAFILLNLVGGKK